MPKNNISFFNRLINIPSAKIKNCVICHSVYRLFAVVLKTFCKPPIVATERLTRLKISTS